MSKASDAALSDLHAELANTLKQAMSLRDDNGAPIASILSVARQFLKDNFITSDASAKAGPLAGLAGLPEFDDDNVVSIARKG